MGDSFVEKFVHEENIKLFRKRLEATTDEAQRKTLMKLLAEEEAKAARLAREAKADPEATGDS